MNNKEFKKEILDLLVETTKFKMECLQTYLHMTQAIIAEGGSDFSVEDLADIGFLCRETAKSFDELRKEAEAKHNAIIHIICKRFAEQMAADPIGDHNGKIRGQYCSCSPDVQSVPKLPNYKRDPQAWIKFCEYFGITGDAAEKGLISFHWNNINEYLAPKFALGEPMPDGVGETVPKFVARFTKKRSFDVFNEQRKLEKDLQNEREK